MFMKKFIDLRPGPWTLHVFPPDYPKHLLTFIANFAKHSNLIVLDCGRQYDASIVARAAHGRKEIIDCINIRRAFICPEVASLIRNTPAGKTPILILDLLSPFYDENVRMSMRQFLLSKVLLNINRLSHGAGLAVSVKLIPASHESFYLFQLVRSSAPRVIHYETPSRNDKSNQLSFF